MRVVVFLLFTAACAAQTPISDPVPIGADDTCGAARYAGVVGQDAFVLERGFRPGDIRIIRPGRVASQEYIPERLTFTVGTNNTVQQISCG